MKKKRSLSGRIFPWITVISVILAFSCSEQPSWKKLNNSLVKKNNIVERIRKDIPDTGVSPSLESGVPSKLENSSEIDLSPGVKARILWGKGALFSVVKLDPGAEMQKEALPSERIMFVMKGSIEQLVDGSYYPMMAVPASEVNPLMGTCPRKDFIYLEKGMESAVKAGKDGAEILEIYSPAHPGYLQKAGYNELPSSDYGTAHQIAPSVEPGRVYDLYEIQLASFAKGIRSRIISGKEVQVSFLSLTPGVSITSQNQPEEQLSLVIRGWIDRDTLDKTYRMEKDDVIFIDRGMVHGGTTGEKGCDFIDIYWPARPDYDTAMRETRDAYNEIIPSDSKVEFIADGSKTSPGLVFTEGPTWAEGKIYFSSMHYDAQWTGDPVRSATVEMDPNGSYRYIAKGMETNGTYPLANGNLAVCDMYNHRVIEMTLTGKLVRTLADSYNGVRLDGPNDLVADAKGGIYFSDPQVVPKPHMQPGMAVYYIRRNCEVIRVVEPGTINKPNGLTLSPDGKILYVDSTPDNFLFAFDVNEDGTLSNSRRFGELQVTPERLDLVKPAVSYSESLYTQADGMKTDELGNIYVGTIIGLQVLNPDGDLVGIINFPTMPVNCCFGGPDGKTIYATCLNKVYGIKTNVRGSILPLQ